MRAVFETSTIADAVGKAASVAPTKGNNFDKCAGVLFLLDSNGTFTVKATNLDIFYLQAVNVLETEGQGEWRLPSTIISAMLAKLPIGSGKTVELIQNGNEVNLLSGRTKCRMRLMDSSYFPQWEGFDPLGLEVIPGLGGKIKMVEWAADTKGTPPLSGVHLDSTKIIATDRYRVATVPIEASPIYEPITVPVGIFDPIIKTMNDVSVGISQGQFLLMPDASTQIRATIFGDAYPNINRVLKREYPNSFKIRKSTFIEMIDRALVFAQGDRVADLSVYIGREELAVSMKDAEVGLFGDVTDIPGYADHKRVELLFTPTNLTEPLSNAPSEELICHYNADDAHGSFYIDGGSGYEAWAQPRKHT